MMRLLLPLFLLASPVLAQTSGQAFYGFGGLNNYIEGSKIADEDAQDLLNVITEKGVLETRPGSSLLYSPALGAVKYLTEFVKEDGTRALVIHAGDGLYASSSAENFVLVSTVTAGASVSTVSAFKRLYITDGSMTPVYWDGASTSTAVGMPACKYVEFADERLFCANLSTETSKVMASEYNAPTSWVIPSTTSATSPTAWYFSKDDGGGVNCLKATPYGLYVGKDRSSWTLKGYDLNTYYKRAISQQVGCVDNRTVQVVPGVGVVWKERDAVYRWDGSNAPEKLSGKLDLSGIKQPALRTWSVNTKTDWGLGISTGWVILDAPRSGQIVPVDNPNHYNVGFEDDVVGATAPVHWTTGNGIGAVVNFSTAGWVWGSHAIAANIRGITVNGVLVSGSMSGECYMGWSWDMFDSASNIHQSTFTDTTLNVQLYYCKSESPYSHIYQGASFTIPALASGEKTLYWMIGPMSSGSAPLDFAIGFPATSTAPYYSEVKSLGANVTAFGNFSVGYTGPATFYIRGSSTIFSASDTTPDWTAQTPNAPVAITTQPYVQFGIEPGITSSSQVLNVDYVLLNYNEGAAAVPPTSLSYDGRYLLSVSTGGTVNDATYVLQKNGEWTVFGGPTFGALGMFNYGPLAGDGTSGGKVWKIWQEAALTDAGVPITSYWVSKDFAFGAPHNIKTMRRVWLDAAGKDTSEVSFGALRDRAGTWATKDVSLTAGTFVNQEIPGLFPSNSNGRYFRFKMSGTSMKVNGYSAYFDKQELYR